MPPIRPLHGMNGRLRQHIHGLGRHFAAEQLSRDTKRLTPDDHVAELIARGELSEDDLRSAVQEVHTDYDRYSFLSRFRDRTLDRADDLFWAKHERNPREDEWGAEYRQVCERLESDPHCYDDVLAELRAPAEPARRYVRAERIYKPGQSPKQRFLNGLAGVLISMLAVGFIGYVGIGRGRDPYAWIGPALFFSLLMLPGLYKLSRFRKGKIDSYRCPVCGEKNTPEGLAVQGWKCGRCDTDFMKEDS